MSRGPVFVFDTSVLSAFCVVGRLDLLEARYALRARWTIEVQDEVIRGIADTPRLSDVVTATWLGDPETSFAVDEIEKIRLRLGGTRSDRRHLGEAATMVVARANGWIVAVDDQDATRLARAEGLPTIGTIPILRACARSGMITAREALDLRNAMVDVHHRRLPVVSLSDFS